MEEDNEAHREYSPEPTPHLRPAEGRQRADTIPLFCFKACLNADHGIPYLYGGIAMLTHGMGTIPLAGFSLSKDVYIEGLNSTY